MTEHKIGTREEWLAAHMELLEAEKELTRRGDELARRRQELPWVRIDKEYRFETDEGEASLADLFRGRSQLLVYHFMFGPEYTAGCPACSAIADGFDGSVVHLANHDVTLCAVSLAPLAKLQAYKRRMGWSFPWASSFGTDFNYDFQVSHTEEQQQSGAVEYNFRPMDVRQSLELSHERPFSEWAKRDAHTGRPHQLVPSTRRVRQRLSERRRCVIGHVETKERTMIDHKIGTREEWQAAREELLAREKEHTRIGDELALGRRELPWVQVEKEYRFDTEDGEKTLAELFDGRSQLLIYHFMFGPSYEAGCPTCSSMVDGIDGL